MQASPEWDIKPRAESCVRCQGAFADQQDYVSRLTLEAEGYVRRDYCRPCWEQETAVAGAPTAPSPAPPDTPPAAVSAVSIWQGVFHAPPPPAPEPLQKETAESLFRNLMARDAPGYKNVIFILAVMLERRRLLVERDVQARDDGSCVRVYEHRRTGETILVTDPNLDLRQLGQVQAEVVAMLGGPAPETPPAAGTAPEGGADEPPRG